MTKFKTLLSQSQFAFWIRGGSTLDSFELCDLAPEDLDATTSRADFVGVVGFSGFVPRVALAQEIDDASVRAISHVLVAIVEQAILRVESLKPYQRHTWSELT